MARHGNTVIPITDKVDLAHFVELNRRQAAPYGNQLLDVLPPASQMIPAREKGPGKVSVTTYAAHNLIDWHFLKVQVAHVLQLQPLVHVLKAQQGGGTLHQDSQCFLDKGCAPGLLPLLALRRHADLTHTRRPSDWTTAPVLWKPERKQPTYPWISSRCWLADHHLCRPPHYMGRRGSPLCYGDCYFGERQTRCRLKVVTRAAKRLRP